jgi:hypothetical protein
LSAQARKSDQQLIDENGGELPFVGSAMTISSSHVPPIIVPLTIDHVVFDRDRYREGDEIVFTLVVTNRGSAPFQLPWSSDPKTIDHKNPDRTLARRIMRVYLALLADGRDAYLGAGEAYGSAAIAGSMRLVGPNETIRVRCLGRWSLSLGHVSKEQFASSKIRTLRAEVSIEDWPVSSPYVGVKLDIVGGPPELILGDVLNERPN